MAFDYGKTLPDGQHERHPGLTDADPKDFVRPLRESYKCGECGVVTRMPAHCARQYAVRPDFYTSTFCCGCGKYLPVGPDGKFTWINQDGTESAEKVGT